MLPKKGRSFMKQMERVSISQVCSWVIEWVLETTAKTWITSRKQRQRVLTLILLEPGQIQWVCPFPKSFKYIVPSLGYPPTKQINKLNLKKPWNFNNLKKKTKKNNWNCQNFKNVKTSAENTTRLKIPTWRR